MTSSVPSTKFGSASSARYGHSLADLVPAHVGVVTASPPHSVSGLQETSDLINRRYGASLSTGAGIIATRLLTHTDAVDRVNNRELDKLPGDAVVYKAKDSCVVAQTAVACLAAHTCSDAWFTTHSDVQRGYAIRCGAGMTSEQVNGMCRGRQVLRLKVGAQVMLTKSIDQEARLVNGARGVVRGPRSLRVWARRVPQWLPTRF